MNYIFCENESIKSIPKQLNYYDSDSGKIRMECILQTVGDINRNKRRYSRELMEYGLNTIKERIFEGSFLGELDHPIDKNPVRQVSVLFQNVSHRIMEYGWDGNRLVAVLDTLRTPSGNILKNLTEDGIPVGFSFRGMGDLREVHENGNTFYDVIGPLHVVTWDAVSFPSHKQAKVIKITESVQNDLNEANYIMSSKSKILHEEAGISECNGLICTKEGVCYLPNDFDKLVNQKVISLMNRYSR